MIFKTNYNKFIDIQNELNDTTYSQINQDINVIKFYDKKTNGFFLDIGAYDGLTLSNTYLLEKNYNWKGLCVEANPFIYNKLKLNRPNSKCINRCVYDLNNKIIDFTIAKNDLLSGIKETLDLHKEIVNKNGIDYKIKTISLENLLEENNIPYFIDYLSIDTEGSEFEILKDFNFDKYIFGYIDIEHNFNEYKRNQIKDLLCKNNYIYIKENYHDDIYIHKSIIDKFNLCSIFTDYKIDNIKGLDMESRFIDVMSDPNNLFIPRKENAGTIEDNCIILHNGIKVVKESYYGDFINILIKNRGCHEPSEERLFSYVLKCIPENGLMIELGSYWAFYSIWFNKTIKNAKNYCIEPDENNLQIGIENCKINNVIADFSKGFISKNDIKVSEFIIEKNINYIDILHSDIQGYEYEMLEDIVNLLDNKLIKYLFISTHSDEIHYNCIKLLEDHSYRIIAAADFETETFCYDGIIVACHKENMELPTYNLGIRKHTVLRTESF